ncbi:MAG: hypothetical protein P8Y53_21505 [Pseudolabrys sp.]
MSDADGKRLQLPRHLVADQRIGNENEDDDEKRQAGDAPKAFHDQDDHDHADDQHLIGLVADRNQQTLPLPRHPDGRGETEKRGDGVIPGQPLRLAAPDRDGQIGGRDGKPEHQRQELLAIDREAEHRLRVERPEYAQCREQEGAYVSQSRHCQAGRRNRVLRRHGCVLSCQTRNGVHRAISADDVTGSKSPSPCKP